MMRNNLIVLVFLTFVFAGCDKNEINTDYTPPTKPEIESIEEKIQNVDWEVTELSEEVVWKYYHFDDLFSSNQSITIFDVDLNDGDVAIKIPYVTSGFLTTSDAGVRSGAIAAINGSFFSTSKGGSTVFFRKDGNLINYTRSGFDVFRENAGFAINVSGDISIINKPADGWKSANNAHTLLVSGPLLVYNSEPVDLLNKEFNRDSHPRTAVGITANNHLIAVVVDGRAPEAAGMTNIQLAKLMDALGADEAMNLDGGGSSTAWVDDRGVVNYPSDNGKFDHGGERGVATVICFIVQE